MAEPFKGVSTFPAMAGSRFPMERVLATYPKDIRKPAIAVLYGFFGRDWSNIWLFTDRFKDRKHLIEMHLCFRCDPGNLVRRARVVTKRLQRIANANTRIVICPVLEDEMTDNAYLRLSQSIKKVTPYRLVRCGLGDRYRGGKYEEHHGERPRWEKRKALRIYNPDGTSVNVDDDRYFNQLSMERFKANAAQAGFAWFIWLAELQGFRDCRGWTDTPPVLERKFTLSNEAQLNVRDLLR